MDRQSKLESKKYGLIRASVWTGRFGRICNIFSILCCIFVLIGLWNPEMYMLLVDRTHESEVVQPMIDDMFLEGLYYGVMGWWLLRVRDAFQAIIEMIDELAETV